MRLLDALRMRVELPQGHELQQSSLRSVSAAMMSEADQRRAWRYADELRKYVALNAEPTSGLLLGVAALLERLVSPQPAEPR